MLLIEFFTVFVIGVLVGTMIEKAIHDSKIHYIDTSGNVRHLSPNEWKNNTGD